MNIFTTLLSLLSTSIPVVSQIVQSSLYTRLASVWGKTKTIFTGLLDQFLLKTSFIPVYYRRNENLWQDGFLIDFLQKKVVDKWTRKFLIVSAYLFNERLVFDRIIRAYLDLVVWSGNRIVIFEYNNIASTLLASTLTLILLFLVLSLNYWFVLLL